MSQITKLFYTLFWKDRACRNLFLLSKEELLDTKKLEIDDKPFNYSLPRIIISNVETDESFTMDTIKNRSENNKILMQDLIESKLKHFEPLLKKLYEEKLKASFEQIIDDVSDYPLKFIFQVIRIITYEEKSESLILDFLKEYKLIGQHLNSLNEVVEYSKNKLLAKKNNELITEKNITTLLDVVNVIKEIYINLIYETLYETNQILVNALHSEDNFESRIKLFHHLYESNIITSSMEDAFVECTNCDPGTYRGVFQLRLNPNKLKNLTCPSCASQVKYFVPYDLHKDVYNIIKEKDGLLLDALIDLLHIKSKRYERNKLFLDNIEIDCVFNYKNKSTVCFVESKMYKINTTLDKLKSKLKKHFGKLTADITRIKNIPDYRDITIVPLLLVNIIDENLLREVEEELKEANKDFISQSLRIVNIDMLRTEIL